MHHRQKPIPNNNNNKVIITNCNQTSTVQQTSNGIHSSGGTVKHLQHHHIKSGGPLDTLPQPFVRSMKTLFDILDDRKTGYVNLCDIEKRWQDDGSKGLPAGVIESLKKVTGNTGQLTFERFCAGLKISLLRNQSINLNNSINSITSNQSIMLNENQKARRLSSDNLIDCISKGQKKDFMPKPPMRPPSAPLLDIVDSMPTMKQWNINNTAAIRPNNVSMQQNQRTLSLPQLSPDSDIDMMIPDDSTTSDENSTATPIPYRQNLYSTGGQQVISSPPPKPPRSAILTQSNSLTLGNLSNTNSAANGGGIDKAGIRHALQNWQMGILMNEMDAKISKINMNEIDPKDHQKNFNRISTRGAADGGSLNGDHNSTMAMTQPALYQKKSRREPRRHTLQNAIDFNLLKRLKQFEEERDILLEGLNAVEKAREWYLQQLASIQEKIKYLGKMSHVEQWSEAQQERLDFQRARVSEINRHLSTLQWERNNFPMHMNLAVRRH